MNHNVHHLAARISNHESAVPKTALERSRKLKSLQVTKNKLQVVSSQAGKVIRQTQAQKDEADKQLKIVDEALAQLEQYSHEIVVTEHALLRYCERVLGIDLEKVHQEIIELPAEQKIMSGKTVVTVYTDPNDHFNLAEREAE